MNTFKTVLYVLLISALSNLPVQAEMLKGGVSDLAEALPPVQPALRAGANFNESNLPAMGTVRGWYWIPSWAAGTWHRETMTYDLPTGRQNQLSRVDHFWGQQIDNRSEIWNHHNEPYGEREEMPGITEYKTVVMKEPVQVTAQIMTVHFRATTVQVERASGRIRRSYQQEEMQYLRPVGQGLLGQESWIKFFDQMGRPLGNEHATAQLTLSQPFVPVSVDPKTGLNLQQDFQQFLAANGFQYLMAGNVSYPPGQGNSVPSNGQPYTSQQGLPYSPQPGVQPQMQQQYRPNF